MIELHRKDDLHFRVWQVYTPSGQPAAYPVPRAIDQQEITQIVQQFADGARNAIAAGMLPKLMFCILPGVYMQ